MIRALTSLSAALEQYASRVQKGSDDRFQKKCGSFRAALELRRVGE